MLSTTLQAVRAVLTADPSVNLPFRNRLLSLMRQGPEVLKSAATVPAEVRIIRRAQVARRMDRSMRSVDLLAKEGILRKIKLPGRSRACGFLESEIEGVIAGKVVTP